MSVFGGIGERTREGNDLWLAMQRSGVLDRAVLVFGQMNEPPGARFRAALSALTMAEYFRDERKQDVLLFFDNIYRYVQAGPRGLAAPGADPLGGRLSADALHRDGTACRSASPRPGTAPSPRFRPSTSPRTTSPTRGRRRSSPISTPPSCSPGGSPPRGCIPPSIRSSPRRRFWNPGSSGASTPRWPAEPGVTCSATGPCRSSSPSSASRSCPRRTRSWCGRARRLQNFLSQPFFVAEAYTGIPGRYVPLRETIRGFREIVEGRHDDVPEQAFFMVGTIDEALKKAKSADRRTGRRPFGHRAADRE